MSRGKIVLVTITAPHFCASIDVERKRFAPIIGYMRHWGFLRVKEYCKRKGWRIEAVRDD